MLELEFMQYFKPLTHLGESTHGNSLKIAQFCGKNADLATLHPTRAAGDRFDWSQVKNKERWLTRPCLSICWAHWQISDLVRCAPFTQSACDCEIESESKQRKCSFKIIEIHRMIAAPWCAKIIYNIICLKEWTWKSRERNTCCGSRRQWSEIQRERD